jgi:Holliday junction resolvase RusA-like endonuclease
MIKIKPLSVNKAWQGKRFKTKEYETYSTYLSYLLPAQIDNIDFNKKLKLDIVVGYSSAGSDIDNFLKPFLDILQKKYEFNDSKIYELNIKKEVVPKKQEFIDFKFSNL